MGGEKVISIKRIKCDGCVKYINIQQMQKEYQQPKNSKNQVIIISHCPYCGRILEVEIIAKNFKYFEILGKSG